MHLHLLSNELTAPLNFNGIEFLRAGCTQYISNVVINVAAIYRNAIIIIPVNTRPSRSPNYKLLRYQSTPSNQISPAGIIGVAWQICF